MSLGYVSASILKLWELERCDNFYPYGSYGSYA